MNDETEQSVEVEEVEVETTESSTEIEETQVESEVESQEEEQEEKKPSRNYNAKQRLRRKLQESEQEKIALLDKLNSLEEKIEGVINPPAPRPSRVDFETEEDYEDSLFEWRDNQRNQKPVTQEPVQQTPQPALDVAPEVLENWEAQRYDVMPEKYEDFEDKLRSIPRESMTDPMTIAIMESKHAGEIAYFLGTNHAEAQRISGLSVAAQIREIDKLGDKFIKPITNAPTPITPPKGGDAPIKDPKDMSMKEYAEYRNSLGK
jgi:hypothetical protein